jgi:hypothetical protein
VGEDDLAHVQRVPPRGQIRLRLRLRLRLRHGLSKGRRGFWLNLVYRIPYAV